MQRSKAHERWKAMTQRVSLKSPNDFSSNEEWRAYARHCVPEEEVNYVLAWGRTQRFIKFYETRKQPFPERFATELYSIENLSEPERTAELEALNNRILVDMWQFLFAAAPPHAGQGESIFPTTPGGIIEQLLTHLRASNPHFAIWTYYTENIEGSEDAISWHEFVACKLGEDSESEMKFTLRMGELGKLLHRYRDAELALPPRAFYLIWFLHNVKEKERNLQARVLVQQLLEAMTPCASA
jgi:hypothetical protein